MIDHIAGRSAGFAGAWAGVAFHEVMLCVGASFDLPVGVTSTARAVALGMVGSYVGARMTRMSRAVRARGE